MTNPFQSPTESEAIRKNWGVLPAVVSLLVGLYFLRVYGWIYYGGYDLLSESLTPPYSAMLATVLYTVWIHSTLLIALINFIAAERWIRQRWKAACLLNLLSCVISPALLYASNSLQ
jgi:hypothetical protein